MYRLEEQYLRPKKAASLRKWHENHLEVREELQVWRGENATILPLRKDPELQFGRGGVVDAQKQYVELSGIPLRIWNCYPVENPEYRDQKVVYGGDMINQWGHFLIEGVCRLW